MKLHASSFYQQTVCTLLQAVKLNENTDLKEKIMAQI